MWKFLPASAWRLVLRLAEGLAYQMSPHCHLWSRTGPQHPACPLKAWDSWSLPVEMKPGWLVRSSPCSQGWGSGRCVDREEVACLEPVPSWVGPMACKPNRFRTWLPCGLAQASWGPHWLLLLPGPLSSRLPPTPTPTQVLVLCQTSSPPTLTSETLLSQAVLDEKDFTWVQISLFPVSLPHHPWVELHPRPPPSSVLTAAPGPWNLRTFCSKCMSPSLNFLIGPDSKFEVKERVLPFSRGLGHTGCSNSTKKPQQVRLYFLNIYALKRGRSLQVRKLVLD